MSNLSNRHILKFTDDETILRKTISEMMDVHPNGAFNLHILFNAMTMLPFKTEIIYDKIYGRWVFTNQHEDDWEKVEIGCNNTSGPNFTFTEQTPEMAMIKGMHYYYHTKLKG